MQLPDFSSSRVLVVGDLMLDRYWHGGTSRISPEAPVPVVHVNDSEERVGGAGNVALNIAALGTQVTILGFSGDDANADTMTRLLEEKRVRCLFERIGRCETITKLRVLSRNQQLIRLDFEDGFHSVSSDSILQSYRRELGNTDVVVLSDYGKGTLRAVEKFIEIARKAGKPVLVDPKGNDFSKYRRATVITPNLSEFEAVVGAFDSEAELVGKASRLMDQIDTDALLVTRGEQGMSLLQRDSAPFHLPTQAREVYDVTGAGDTVISVLAASLAAGCSMPDATSLANLAAGVVVGKLGTATIALDEFRYALHRQRAHHKGVIELDQLLETLEAARFGGEKIVATNGCFDILHPGHAVYLQQAKALGDRLVVMVNSDASVQALKGPGRPVNPLATRMAMLAALECVDWVISFDDETPRELICQILPDILVKGGDYKNVEDIAGYDCVQNNGGEVRLMDYVDGFSTTKFINNLRENA